MRFFVAVVGLGVLPFRITSAVPSFGEPFSQTSNENSPSTGDSANPTQTGQKKTASDQANASSSQSRETGDNKESAQANPDNHTLQKTDRIAKAKVPSPKSSVNNSPAQAALSNQGTIAKIESSTKKLASPSISSTKPPVSDGTAALGGSMFRKPTGDTTSLGGLKASNAKTSTASINGTGMQRPNAR